MSTKAQIQTSINTINDGGVNTAAEVRAVHNTELDNNYANAISETHLSGTITTQTSDSNFYTLFFCKQGRKVTVTGRLINKQMAITTSTSFFEIINSEYFPASAIVSTQKIIGNASNDNRPIKLRFTSNKLLLDGSSLGVAHDVYVTFEYLTEN